MSSQYEDTQWTLWQVLNWIISREPENLPPWQFTAIKQVRAGLPDRELLPPLEIDAAQPAKAELVIRNLGTGEVTEYSLAESLRVDSVVDDAKDALVNTLQKGSMKVIGRSPGNDLHDEVDARNWVKPQLTDKQGVKIRSTEFEDLRFLADEIKKEWPERLNGLLDQHIAEGDLLPSSSSTDDSHDESKPPGPRYKDYEDWEDQQSALVKRGMNLRDAATKVAKKAGVDPVYVERETRRIRRERGKSGIESGRN